MRRSSDTTNSWWEQTTETLSEGEPPAVEVFVRSLAPPLGGHTSQESLIETLLELQREGELSSVEVTVWGDGVCPDGCYAETVAGNEVLEQAMELKRWAEGVEPDVEIPFEETHVSSSVTGETFRKIVLPQITVGVYDEGGIALVLPARVDGEHHRVADLPDVLEQPDRVRGPIESSV